ncbi:MAG: hypothetical protein ACKO8Q_00805 [Bacteroidota bacterium]
MKAELIERFKTVLQAEDIMSVRDQVRIIRGEWKSETTKEKFQARYHLWKVLKIPIKTSAY